MNQSFLKCGSGSSIYPDQYEDKVNDDLAGEEQRVVRGAGYNGGDEWLRCSARDCARPSERSPFLGFRVTADSPPPEA